MNKTIVFGASGFVGKVLLPLLEDVVAPSSSEVDLSNPVEVKIIPYKEKGGVTVIMLAALTPEKGNVRDTTIKNIIMARNALEVIKYQDVKHFIYVSSDAVYSMSGDVIITEETPVCPDTLYGHMHAMREQYFRDAIPEDKLTIIRPCAIYGKGDTHNSYGINRFVRDSREKGEITLFGEGEEYRDHIHVDDVAAIIAKAAKEKIAGTFNAVSGLSVSFFEVASAIGGKIVYVPRKMPITHRNFDNSLLLKHFPEPRNIEDGIKDMLQNPPV